MTPFAYGRVDTVAEAVRAVAGRADTAFLAGGTELMNWMRLGIAEPARVLDIGRLKNLDAVEALPGGGVRIGALCRLNDVAQHPLIAVPYRVLSQSILKAASAQLRNLATIGGNILQRTRCAYFRAEETLPCNKRAPGSGCSALHGVNDKHAIFGWTETCVATQPSDPVVALAALDADILVQSAAGPRRIPARDFHRLPDGDAATETALLPGELILGYEIAAPAPHSAYFKVRERESYEYATVSAAVALELEGGAIRRARVALGSVALKPWRLDAAEALLIGKRPDDPGLAEVLAPAFAEARALSQNAYKIPLARSAAARTIRLAAEAA